MNIVLWVLQVLLALHTAVGAVWKFSNPPEQAVPSLAAIPSGLWLGMGAIELMLSLDLLLPALSRRLAILAPIAAGLIGAEMLLFCALHLQSGDPNRGPLTYWGVVAVWCAFVAYGRFKRLRLREGTLTP